jgi:hypothetical protein
MFAPLAQVDKFVRVSRGRVTSAEQGAAGDPSLKVTALGAAGEEFALSFIAPGGIVRTVVCQIGSSGEGSGVQVACSGTGAMSACHCSQKP